MTDIPKTLLKLDIFISSPGDVREERDCVNRIIQKLNRQEHIRNKCHLNALAYEDTVPSAIGESPQMVVDKYMMAAGQSDIFICIMGHRMGTPVTDEATGKQYLSGTEYEFMDAYRANQEGGKPHIFLYRSGRPAPTNSDPEQQESVQAFFQRFESGGDLKGLYKSYQSIGQFEDMLFQDLNTIIVNLLDAQPGDDQPAAAPVSWVELSQRVMTFNRMMGTRYGQKYNPDCHVPRQDAADHFARFLASDKITTVITGKAGTGKSSFVRGLLDTHLPEGSILWLQDCTNPELNTDEDIDSYIAQGLQLGLSGVVETFKRLLAEDSSRKIVLLFDAVNEYPERVTLMTRLAEFVTRIDTSAIKVILTCRIPAWNSLSKYFKVPPESEYHAAGPDSFINLDAFTLAELPKVYASYQKLYTIKTDFKDLSEQVKVFISQPLFLKLTAIAYQGEAIPRKLVLRKVFGEYVNRCLGENGLDGEEFQVLRRAIELMYENTQRELKLAVLRQDREVGQYVVPEIDQKTPYTHLVDAGLFTQHKVEESLLRKIEMVFVTYERVFEFLLAEIVCGDVSTSKILELLELARSKSFVQLRGAVELAFTFALIHNSLKTSAIIEIARQDRPESRQFLSDVIQTVYESGEHGMAEKIITDLSRDDHLSSKLLALHVAYQLRLDDQLVNLALSDDTTIRDTAGLYIYQIWNRCRQAEKLDDGYRLIHKIADSIKLINPKRSIKALTALVSVTISLMVHIIDDPDALLPLVVIYQDLLRTIPGLEPRSDRGIFGRFLSDTVTPAIIGALTQVLAFLLKETVMNDAEFNEAYFKDPRTKRALLDVGSLLDLDNLLGHEDDLVKLITWPHPFVHVANTGTMIHFLYHQPEVHMPMMQRIFDGEYNYNFRVKFDVLNSMVYAAVCRVRGGKTIPEGYFQQLEDNYMELWQIAHEVEPESGKTWIELDVEGDKTFMKKEGVMSPRRALRQGSMVGMFTIEAIHQRRTYNSIQGSEFLPRFMNDPSVNLDAHDLEIILEALEGLAYQGNPEFAIRTILDERVRRWWDDRAPEICTRIIANIRSFNQEIVDDLLLEDEKKNRELWDQVRSTGGIPNVGEVILNNANIWMISSSIEWVVLKVIGVAAFEFAFSRSIAELMSRMTKICVTALFDYDVINIGYAEWHLAHNPNWNNWEKWDIPRNLDDVRPDVHEYYRTSIQEFIKTSGKGLLYGEL